MPRRRAGPSYEVRHLKIATASIAFDYSDIRKASHAITIDGEIDHPVLRTQKVSITVLSPRVEERYGAFALGVTGGVWRIAASFRAEDFTILLSMVAGRMLAFGELTSEPILRGRGTIHSIALSTHRSD